MKIISWNVNSIRKRINAVLDIIDEENPDIFLLQETKCLNEEFPLEELEIKGFSLSAVGQKGRNGSACLSRRCSVEDKRFSFPGSGDEARYAEILVCSENLPEIEVASVYVPNGGSMDSERFAFKLSFLDSLRELVKGKVKSYRPFVLAGDFNVALENFDVYDPDKMNETVCFNMECRNRVRLILNDGMHDARRILNPHGKEFTWWDYRSGGIIGGKGMRIDFVLLNSAASDLMQSSKVLAHVRDFESPSDHAPIVCTLN